MFFLEHMRGGHDVLTAFFSMWPWILGLLASILLLSGLDNLVPFLICVYHRSVTREPAPPFTLGEFLKEERRIAIFVPCWKEADVIANMVRHNLAAMRYRNFDFFLGVYPNDEATVARRRAPGGESRQCARGSLPALWSNVKGRLLRTGSISECRSLRRSMEPISIRL